MKLKYNRLNAGDRLRQKRLLLGLTQDDVAEKIELSPKFYADIERGSCGMSIETLISLGKVLDMSLDYIIYGKTYSDEESQKHSDEISAVLSILDNAPENKRKYLMRLLQLQIAICDPETVIEE